MKLSGKNFQPWPDFSLDISGLTIVIGPSNGGKSSLYRALRGIVRNELDVAYIRNPKSEPLELTLEHEGKTITTARSKKGSVHYQVGEDKFDKLAGDVPPAVSDFKFGEVKIGDFIFDPIFASQNRPQFLIDDETFKPSEINAILGAFGGTEKLEAGKKQANLQKTQKDGEARVLAGQIRTAEEHKARLTDLSAKARAVIGALGELEASAHQLESEVRWITDTLCCVRKLRPLQRLADSLVLPDVSGIEELQRFRVCAEQAALANSFSKWINKPLQAIESTADAWSGALALWRQIKALNETAAVFSSGFDTQELQAFRMEISANDLIPLRTSIEFLEHVIALRRELQETAEKSALVDDQLSAAQSELSGLASRVLCPKCGKAREHVCDE
jgi:energy-coupling factor transporter ATP-binding protein EcfA2